MLRAAQARAKSSITRPGEHEMHLSRDRRPQHYTLLMKEE
jgi:hypothetical protein